jgi:CRISPR-associated protein (TIGR02584 family)
VPKNILVVQLGTSPAILTEAIYYYARISNPSVSFDEVYLLTTEEGEKVLRSRLLGIRTGTEKPLTGVVPWGETNS